MPVARHGMICVRRASVLAPSAGSFTGASGCRATLSWASAAGPELACAEAIVSSLNCEFTLPPRTGAQLLFKDRPQVVKLILDARPERRHSSLTPFRAEQQSHLLARLKIAAEQCAQGQLGHKCQLAHIRALASAYSICKAARLMSTFGVKRTFPQLASMSVIDPKRTSDA